MKTIVREMGDRPAMLTPARMNAPQGAKALADMLAPLDFADLAILTLDWEGDGFTPAFVVECTKWVPKYSPSNLQLEPWVIDMEDAFGVGNMTNSTLQEMVSSMREAMESALERRERFESGS